MNEFCLLISLFLTFYFLLVHIKILYEQYYSPLRMIKSIFLVVLKKKAYYASYIVFFLGGIILYILEQEIISFTILTLINYLSIIDIKLKDYHFTRRNLLLLSLSYGLNVILLTFVYEKIGTFLGVILTLFSPFLSLILMFYCLWPIEELIKKHYIKLAREKVQKNNYIVIGVTGSFGKTTTKNFIYSLLKDDFLISSQNHNYNTVMGLCKYINTQVRDDDEILLVELGVDHLNSMKKFKEIFLLDYAIVTSIGEMHLATFKNLENIIKEKLSIRFLLKENGKLYLNNEIVSQFPQYLDFDFLSYSENDLDYSRNLFYNIKYNNQNIETKLLIKKQLSSLMIAIILAENFNISKNKITYLISRIEIPQRRLSTYMQDNFFVIDNSYNGNLVGIKEILEAIKNDERMKIVFTGGLIELGEKYQIYNEELGKNLNIVDKVYLITNDKNHPLKRTIQEEKLVEVSTYLEAYRELKNYQEMAILLLLSKGSDIYLH